MSLFFTAVNKGHQHLNMFNISNVLYLINDVTTRCLQEFTNFYGGKKPS